MATKRLDEINQAALKPIDSTDQPKAMKLFRKTPGESGPLERSDRAELAPPSSIPEAAPVAENETHRGIVDPAEAPGRRGHLGVDGPQVSFMAKISESSYAALEDAVIEVRRRGGIRKFSRADVTEAMFLLFADVVEHLDPAELPTKAQHRGLAFRRALKELIEKTLREAPTLPASDRTC